jgi:phosphate transport system permease protein
VVSDDPSAHGPSTSDATLPDIAALSPAGPQAPHQVPVKRQLKARFSVSDLVFRAIARAGGSIVLILLILIGTFLAYRATLALHKVGWSFLTTQTWNPEGGAFGIASVMVGTALIALVAIAVAGPLSIGTALYISEYAPRGIQRLLTATVDLMAAVPSVIFGMWGAYLLEWKLDSAARWISDWFYWIPLFQVNLHGLPRDSPLVSLTSYTGSSFMAGAVVGLMITPIAGSIMREAFSQAPVGEREGAYALGATRWGMIRAVVLPFSRGAMIGGTMLGLGRALGETMAVLLIISLAPNAIQPHILEHGGSSVSALIASQFQEATPFGVSALFAAGVSLFAITLLVNFIAAQVVARSRSGAVSEA